ncbi:MAG: hypothetical protein AAFP97_07485 [Pseudomonadota bacterium]
MASIPVIPAAVTPVSVTETRKVRADNRTVAVEKSVDVSHEPRKPAQAPINPSNLSSNETVEAPIDEPLSDVRPVIERLDGEKDASKVLETEEADQQERALQASEAYSALRKPDADLTPVGTI